MISFFTWLPNFIQALNVLQPIISQVMEALRDPSVDNEKLHAITLEAKASVTDEERKNASIKLVNFSFDRK